MVVVLYIMDTFVIKARIPVDATVVESRKIDNVRLKICINDDLSDDVCEKTIEKLRAAELTRGYPMVWIRDTTKYIYFNIPESILNSMVYIVVHEGIQLRCDILFKIQCKISPMDDVPIDIIKPIELVHVF